MTNFTIAALATAALALGGCTAYAGTGTPYPRGYYGSPYYGGGPYYSGHYYSSHPRAYYYGAPRVQRYQPYVHQAPPAYRPYVAPPAYRR